MAVKDANFYKYLEAAFRYRLFNPVGKTATANTVFRYLGYNLPFKRIFYYARQVLPGFYRNTAEFPDTEEGNLKLARVVLEKLDKHKDLQLEYQFKGTLTKEQERLVLDRVEVESRQNGTAPEQTAPVPAAGTSTGGIPGGMPSAPTISFGSRKPQPVINKIPHAPEPEPASKLYIANKSGKVVGEATITPSRTTIENTAPKTSTLYTANSSGAITGKHTISSSPVLSNPKPEAPQPKLVLANSSGIVKEAPPKQIFITNKGGVITKMHDIKTPGWLKTFGSNTQIFAKRNLGKVFDGLKEIAGGIGRGIAGPGLTGAANVLGRTGLGAINHGGNFLSNLSDTRLKLARGAQGAGSLAGKAKGRGGLAFVSGILGFMLLTGGIAISGTAPADKAAPVTSPGGGTQPQPPSLINPPPPPPADGNYKKWVKDNFKINIDALTQIEAGWAYEVLNSTANIAPKFQDLIASKPTTAIPVPEGSHTSGDIISIRTGYDSDFFKQIFVHELGHRIKGTAGTTSPQCAGTSQTLEQIEKTEGYLTYYSEHATPAHVKTPACGSNDQITQSDEDFAESVSYYINSAMRELNYGSGCSTYNQTANPYNRTDQPRPAHKAYIQCLLGP